MTSTDLNAVRPPLDTEPDAGGAPFAETLLEILFDVSSHSESLMATRHSARVSGCEVEIPKFMLLGQRGGGKPIRVALFSGTDDRGSLDGFAAIARLLLEAEMQPALAQDYAIFAYPLINVPDSRLPFSRRQFPEPRYPWERPDGDVQFLRSELRKWRFDAILTLGSDPVAEGFHAVVRSNVLAKEVVLPALERVETVTPVKSRPVRLRPGDLKTRLADHADGKLTPPPELRPYPFEAELFAPGSAAREERIRSLFISVHEILRNYRRLLAHASNI